MLSVSIQNIVHASNLYSIWMYLVCTYKKCTMYPMKLCAMATSVRPPRQ